MEEQFKSNDVIKNELERAARWAKFLSFFGFFILGFFIINILVSEISAITLSWVIFCIIMLVPFFYLYLFARNTNAAILGNNTKKISSSFKNLARFFHFWGIFSIIIITLYIFRIVLYYSSLS